MYYMYIYILLYIYIYIYVSTENGWESLPLDAVLQSNNPVSFPSRDLD